VSPHLVDAADHGVPQHRVRVFVVCTRSSNPIQLRLPKRDHVAVNSVIDWDGYSWTLIDKPGRSAATLARVASGRAKFGRRFVAPFYGSGSGETGRSVDRPIGTLTTIDRWLVVDGDRCRVLQPAENLRIMGMKPTTVLPKVKRQANHLIGNAVAPPVVTDLLNSLKECI
jgi:DNA (cytosine-5)-methyltransferase 1